MDNSYYDDDPPPEGEDGSKERFEERAERWRRLGLVEPLVLGAIVPPRPTRWALARHHAWWLVHNLVAHPLIGVLPIRPFFAFHDWTSHRLNARHRAP